MASLKLLPPSGVKKEIINTGYYLRKYSHPKKFQDFNRVLAYGLYVSAAVLYQLSYEDPYIGSRPIC